VTEQKQVPDATFASYYGRPILKVTRWKEPHLPAYLFLGELSGAAAVLGAPEALPALQRLKREDWQLDDPRPWVLDDALRACATER